MADVLLNSEYQKIGITERHQNNIRTLGAVSIFLKWIKNFYWAQLNPIAAYFVVQLGQTVKEMAGFTILLILCIIAFTNFFMVIQKNKAAPIIDEFGAQDPPDYVTGFLPSEFVSALISVYLLSLGEFAEIDGYSEGHTKYIAWFMFIAGTIIIQLIFMNMLIAVMSTPFGEVLEKATLFRYRQQLSFIVDFIDHVDIKKQFKNMRYVMVVKPEDVVVN